MAAVGTVTKVEVKDEQGIDKNVNMNNMMNANQNQNRENSGSDSNRGRGGGQGGRGRGGGRGRDFRGGGRGGRGGGGNSRFDNSSGEQHNNLRRDNISGNNDQNNRSHNSGDWNSRRDHQNNSNIMQESSSMMSNDVVEAKKEMKKFTGRCRLFVGNLSNDVDEEAFKQMFSEYGEISEVYLSKGKGFGFIRLDTRMNAQAAKDALDGSVRKGREIRVRFATHGAALKVKHLPPNVSNELLEEAFSKFGEIERAIVVVDDRGRSTGEGVVEFARKPGASKALQAITDGVLLLTSSPRPIIVEPLEQTDEEDGLQERYMTKNHQFMKDREQPPRFAPPGSFEYEFGQRWKQLYEMEAKEKERLKKEMEDAIEKLEMEMTNALHDHTANKLREELRRIEELKAQDERRRMEMLARRQDEDRMRQEQEERRRQEQLLRNQQQEEMMRRRQQYRHDDLMMIDTGMGSGGIGGGGGIGGRGPRDFGNNDRRNRDNADRDSNQGELDNSGASPMQPPPKPPVGLGVDPLQDGQLPNAQSQMRQTRFDQPPNNPFGGMMGQGRDLMRERMMERRENRPREEYIDQKRSRRF